jgi:exonuclease III
MIMVKEQINVLSLNVRGLGDGKKRREIFRWLKRYHKASESITFLQETHTVAENEKTWERDWGSKVFFSHGASNARGVAILMPTKFNFVTELLWRDEGGRILAVCIKSDDFLLNLVNIYAPTKDKPNDQNIILEQLQEHIKLAETPTLLGGDLNTYLDPVLDKKGGKTEPCSKFAIRLQQLMDEYNLIDVWRSLNPGSQRYTWRQTNPCIQSRLDYFLLSGEMLYVTDKCDIKPSIKTDHSLLQVSFKLTDEERRGPGFWKFNNALLKDENYINCTREFIEKMKLQNVEITNKGLKWDLIKSEIRHHTITYSKKKAKLKREYENNLHKQFLEASDAFNMEANHNNLQKLEEIKQKIEDINASKTEGAFIRSKAEHVEKNERSTAYFLNIEKRNYKMKHIKKLNISEIETITDPVAILDEELRFYSNLYSNNVNINVEKSKEFFNDNVPKLNEDDKNCCEQPITATECSKALLSLNNGKSPGSDGFTTDFYKMFWTNIVELTFDSINYAIQNGELSIEQKRGVLKLIPKKDKNPCFLKNWRPISLLNTDYKIIAQVFAIRLQEVLPSIISEFQNGYIKGRFIGYNIRTIIDVINHANNNKKDCLIVFLDFEKAFDQLDWDFIQKTLESFNFGKYFKGCVKTMYHNITSCVMNNGYASKFFSIHRGIRQGCPLSALLFILAVEILSIHLRKNGKVKGVTVNNTEIKLTQLADDTTLFLEDRHSLSIALKALQIFYENSGLKLNYSKTEVLPVGIHNDLHKCPVKVVQKSYSLGIWYFNKVDTIIVENHQIKLAELEKIFSKWKSHKLSLYGKSTVIKTLATSKLLYVISSLSTPQWYVEEAQKMIFKFLWDDKMPRIKNSVIINTPEKGGLKIPDMECIVKSQKIAWVKRILKNPNATWMEFLYTTLPDMDVKHLLRCSVDPKLLANNIPNFYRQILYAWYEMNPQPISIMDIRREILWYNKNIKVGGESLFEKQLYVQGIVSVNDLLNDNGQFMSYKDFISAYDVRINQLRYISIIDAIPIEWRKKLKSSTFPKTTEINMEDPHIDLNSQQRNILVVESRDLYIELVKKIEGTPSCIKAWNDRCGLSLTVKDWENIFCLPRHTLCDTKVIEVQYKILHRSYATNSIISKWDHSKSPTCEICGQKANIIHNFFSCTQVQTFWKHFQDWIKDTCNDGPYCFTLSDILFGKYMQAKHDFLNHALLYAKYFIHKQFVAQNQLFFTGFIYFYKNVLVVEKERLILQNKADLFVKRFSKCRLIE